MSVYQGTNLIAGGRQCMPLLSFMWADHQLNDISWLRADTFSWQSGTVYTAVYQHLVDDIDGKTLQSETIGGTTIQFYLADDGHKICPVSQESNVAAIYAATGVAWYYILDTTNQRFKLPRTKFGFTGLRDTVGRYVQEGLPNLNGGSNGWVLTNTDGAVGVFSGNNFTKTLNGYVTNPNWNIASNGGEWYRDINFNAALSNAIYGRSDTVQPKATQMYLYFYVGQFTQTALENTAGLNASLFNDKADISLANLSAAGKEVCANMAMPSNTFETLTLGASGTTYTASADGYVYFEGGATSGTKYGNITNTSANMSTAGVSVSGISNVKLYLPVKKGDGFRVTYSLDTAFSFRFIYAKGAQ